MDVVTLGESMGVLYPPEPVGIEHSASLLFDVGGAESNLAIRLARMGHPTRFISRVGNDPFGRRIRATLDSSGVDTTYLAVDASRPTGIFFREWLPDGERRVYYYRAGSAACQLTPDDLPAAAFAGARVVHLTGITPALSAGCATVVARAIELAHAAGALVSFDPNYRRWLWQPPEARTALLPLMRQSDIILMGHEDAQALFGHADTATALAEGAALGARVVVLKQAEQGASALVEGRRLDVPASPVRQVLDPVGAGDAFNAGFLAGWLRGQRIEEALALGARSGAAAVETLGDYAGDAVG